MISKGDIFFIKQSNILKLKTLRFVYWKKIFKQTFEENDQFLIKEHFYWTKDFTKRTVLLKDCSVRKQTK